MGTKAVSTSTDKRVGTGGHAKQKHAPPAEEQRALVKLGDATRMLAEVRDAPSAKKIADMASAAMAYAKKAKLGASAVDHADEIRIRATRLFWEYYDNGPKNDGGRPSETGSTANPVLTLSDLGFSKREADEARKLHELSAKDFELVATHKERLSKFVAAANRAQRTENLAEISKGNAEASGTAQRYPVIYGDPPWRYEHVKTENRAIENHYPTMDLGEIEALPIAELATDDAILFLWATSPKLAEAMSVVEAWGFTYRTCMVWIKDRIGMGYYARQRHEILLIATRGSPPTPPENARPDSVIESPLGKHSAKPAEFAEAIERMYPTLPKIELFCRSPREGWAAWGNQS